MTRETPVALLVTSNGTGMGHLARQVAVASALARPAAGDPPADAPVPSVVQPVLLSMSSALPLVAAATGLCAEYCPGPTRRWMRPDRWHRYLRARLVGLAREVGADVLAFDGVSPYPGLLAARRDLADVPFVWFRRGLWQPRASRAPLRTARYFDLVLEPGDLAEPGDNGPTAGLPATEHLAPLSLLETEDPLPRAQAAAELGIDPDRPTLLVGLGAGDLDDPSGRTGAAVAAALHDPQWQVAVVQSPLAGSRLPEDMAGRVTSVSGVFPLVRYLAAFDAAASSAGYNAVHELVLGGLPTLLVPSSRTSTDDQVARAGYVAAQGWALAASGEDPPAIAAGVRRLLDASVRADLRSATGALAPPTGASAAARRLAALTGGAAEPVAVHDPYRALRAASILVRRGVGEQGWERARQLRGAPPRSIDERPLPVVETDGAAPAGTRRLLVTHDLAAVTADSETVVEHVLAGSSDGYLAGRRTLARAAYDTVAAPPPASGPLRLLVVTIVHNPYDARILYREIAALRAAGHEVTYAAPFTACAVEPPEGLRTVDLPRATGRRRAGAVRAARSLLRAEADRQDLVLLHDPELLASAAGLRLPPVVWDVHEDTAAAVTLKPWLPGPLRPATAAAFGAVESAVERRRHLILAETSYAQRFRGVHPVVPNSTSVPREVPPPGRDRVVYLGALTRARGAYELIALGRLLAGSGVRVELVGSADGEVRDALAAAHEVGSVTWHGFVPNDEALRLLEGALAGLSLLHDEPNYRHSRPTKVIEYMAHGVPVLTTPTPQAQELVEAAGCGLVVPFGAVEAVAAAAASALRELAAHPDHAAAMGRAGHEAALAGHDWTIDGPAFVTILEGWAR